ncbi:flavin reductase family protein [Chachezhania antarctica]|uniref:flavin reductase family protein n=1 Tax=Chachezhania antarctica TaxID=2340860 RepID=UPI001F08DF80|nr:flavin reductase family protein [Chachezhania antarctica]|tara:strand:+ start:93 stop:614 length:522 start_codon:yes stop_codon:yes gene_type:complete
MTDPDPSRQLSEFTPKPGTTKAFREALGCFGTGVTIVTALNHGAPVAMTANSFSAVSLDPPLVLWCPARKSQRHDWMVEAQHFSIHVVAEDQEDLAARFARTGDDFDGVDWVKGPEGVPHLAGCLARFDCHRHAVHDGGDHSIIVGHVAHAAYRAGQGLIFKRGQYGGFAGPI